MPSSRIFRASPTGYGPRPHRSNLFTALAGTLCLFVFSVQAASQPVTCHYTYGGETKRIEASPVPSPYTVKSIQVGSYFQFRVVVQDRPADIASVKVYTYADRDDGPVLIHQGTYPYPPRQSPNAPHGFTGLHAVYEPTRDGELQYWCEASRHSTTSKHRLNGGSR